MHIIHKQTELPGPIPWNQTSDVHRGSLLSKRDADVTEKPSQHNNKFGCSGTKGFNIPQYTINEVYLLSIKYRFILLRKKTLTSFIGVIRMIDFNRAELA